MIKRLISLFVLALIFFTCSSSKVEESYSEYEYKIINREEWGALSPKPFATHIPNRITLHHEGTYFDPEKRSAGEHIKRVQAWGMGEARNWVDIPYHFIIDFDGNIFEGRNVFTVGETATDYNPEGHLLITCIGNFEEQEVADKQMKSLIKFVSESCIKYQIDPETIRGHKDFTSTACPGKNLYKYLESGYIINEVKKTIVEISKNN